MSAPDREFDPDDNFENSREADAAAFDEDDEASLESLVWQLLLVINPGDDETALRQFEAWRERMAEGADVGAGIRDAIDWVSGFHVEARDPGTLIDALAELAARWNLHIDWGVEDPTDAEFLAGSDAGTVLARAYDQLRERGYTLWSWTPEEGTDEAEAHVAGWMCLSRDDEAMRLLAPALGFQLRPGNDVG